MAKGGARPGAGRPRKDEEDRAKRLTIAALVKQFGGEEEAFEHAALMAATDEKDGYRYFRLLVEYAYGKPREKKDVNLTAEQPIFQL